MATVAERVNFQELLCGVTVEETVGVAGLGVATRFQP